LWFYGNNSTSSTTAAPTKTHSIKAKSSSSKSQLLFYFCRTRHSGAPSWKIILHIIDFEKNAKALVAGAPWWILDNFVYSRRSSTNGWQGTNLGRQANEKA
jgi:hypothetical protein